MKNSKIAIIAPALLPVPAVQSGGIEQLIENIINQNEIEKRAHFTIISAYSPLTKDQEKNYNHSDFKNIHYNFIGRCFNFLDRKFVSRLRKKEHLHWGLLQMMRIVQRNKFDKIVIFGNDFQILPVSLVAYKDKIIYYQATLMLQKANDFLLCDKIFVGSNHSKNSILNHIQKLDPKRIKLIQSGIDTKYFKQTSGNTLCQKYKIPKDIPIIGYLGRIVASKGVIELLKAALLIKDVVPFKLILMGTYGSNFGGERQNYDSKEEMEIKKMVEELGDKCIVTGFVTNEILPEFLSAVDIGVVPSIVEDVSPLTYFQYQAMGTPTIVSDAGGIPEFYSQNHSIMVSRGMRMSEEIASALLTLINNKSKRIEMASYLVKDRENLGVQRYYNNFIDLVTT
jgi:spore coat protein SA